MGTSEMGGPALRPLNILLVEDDPDDFVLARDMFAEIGANRFKIDWARSYQEGREWIVRRAHDIYLIDFRLGAENGLDLLREAIEMGCRQPLILLTGQGDRDIDLQAMELGAADYLVKGHIETPVLERSIRYAVARSRAEQAQRRLATILEATTDFVSTVDPQGKVLFVNKAGCQMVGVSADELPRLGVTDLYATWAGKLILETALPAAIREGAWTGETALRHRAGHEIPVSQVIVAHKGPDGRLEYWSTIARDLTERKAQEEKIQRLSRIHAVLSGINSTIVRVKERQELFDEACRIAVDHGEFIFAWIGLLEHGSARIAAVAHAGRGAEYLSRVTLSARADAPEGQGLTGLAVRSRQPVVCNDIEGDPRPVVERQAQVEFGFRSSVMLPLIVSGEVVGVLLLFAAQKNFFDEEEMKLLNELAGDIAFALDHIAKEEKLDYLAYYDVLTGLPNRSLFVDRLGQRILAAQADGDRLAVIVGDIDGFTSINDSLGQSGGDVVLREVAARLQQALPAKDTVARLGADEYAITIAEVEQDADIARLVSEILPENLGRPIRVGETELHITLRWGIAMYPMDGADSDMLMRNAEAARQRCLEVGERSLFYAPEMNARVSEKLTLRNRLVRALENEQFVLHYQAKVDVRSGRVTGFEALLRWQDPERGLISPAQFIPLLEETGLILDAGRWVIGRALSDRARWCAVRPDFPSIAVNVSPVQLRRASFVDEFESALVAAGSAGPGLDLEITESLFMEDLEGSIRKLEAIRHMGAGIGIDDFGTGYSSLRYIARLPVDVLKIDRSFVVDLPNSPDDMGVVSTVISLAHALDMQVVAEGVETAEQLKLLRLLKCDQAQGYLFSKPVPREQVLEVLDQSIALPE